MTKEVTVKLLRKSWCESCVYRVRDSKRPYSGEVIAQRIVVAVPNMEGTRPYTNTPCVSFARKYLVFETLDLTTPDEVERTLKRIKRALATKGFVNVEDHESYEERMLHLMGLDEAA